MVEVLVGFVGENDITKVVEEMDILVGENGFIVPLKKVSLNFRIEVVFIGVLVV